MKKITLILLILINLITVGKAYSEDDIESVAQVQSCAEQYQTLLDQYSATAGSIVMIKLSIREYSELAKNTTDEVLLAHYLSSLRSFRIALQLLEDQLEEINQMLEILRTTCDL